MAKSQMKMPEDFLLKVSRLGEQTDTILPRVLQAGGEVVLAKVQANLDSSIGRATKYPSQSTGELQASLGLSPAKQDRKGDFNVKIGFSEPRRGGGSNAKLASILEYGKHGQPAKPFLKPAKSASKAACENAMRAKLEEEIEKL